MVDQRAAEATVALVRWDFLLEANERWQKKHR
jgi:hypothetical protein